MNSRQSRSFALFAAATAGLSTCAAAAITYLGPTRYQSAADSPFAAQIQAGTVFLEDFEDRTLNTPYVTTTARWHSSESFPRSVDGDDGVIDGDGGYGGSFGIFGRYGTVVQDRAEFSFSPDPLGRLPTFVGLVVTAIDDVRVENLYIDFDAWGPTGVQVSDGHRWIGFAAGVSSYFPYTRTYTGEAQFVGFYDPAGISMVAIGGGVTVLDHLQYGYVVPEPQTGLLWTGACLWLLLGRRSVTLGKFRQHRSNAWTG